MHRTFLLTFFILSLSSCMNFYETKKKVKGNAILFLEIKGLITSATSEEFMKHIREYAGKSSIKGILIRVNSPGGTVGASQEIHDTIQDIKTFYKKPVVVSGGDVVASGGVYSIMPADKIFINRGTLFGSIGVLMQFQNFSELARWAKIDMYSLKAGEFKDSGSPFREMTLRERELFENTLDTVLSQFKNSIMKGRSLEEKVVDSFSDGRIMTGEEALEFGLVDEIGSLNKSIRVIGKLAGLGSEPELFSPSTGGFLMKYLGGPDAKNTQSFLSKIVEKLVTLNNISGQPLFVLPSYLSPQ